MAASPFQAPNGLHITASEHLKDCLGASPQHLTREGGGPRIIAVSLACDLLQWVIMSTGHHLETQFVLFMNKN